MAEVASIVAAATCPHRGIFRAHQDFQCLLPSSITRSEIMRSNCLKLGPPLPEDSWKSTQLLPDSNKSVVIASTVQRPVFVDVQDNHPDSVLLSFGIAEQCARHEKILQYLMSGSKAEREGLKISLLSDLMGLHTVAIDLPQISASPFEDEFYLYGVDGAPSSLIYPGSGICVPKPILDFVGDLPRSSMITVNQDGRVLFTGTQAEVNNLLSMISEFYPSKTSAIGIKKPVLVPHFSRMSSGEAEVCFCELPLKLKTSTVAPVKSPGKVKLKPPPRKKQGKKAIRVRDLYRNNYFLAWESLLSVLLNKQRGKTAVLSLKKSGPELSEILTQFSAGIAGTGIAVIFSIMCKIAGGRVPFCASRLLNTGFGFGLVWLSGAFYKLRETVLYVTKNSSKVVLNEDEAVQKVNKCVNDIFFRATTLMVVAALRFV